MRFAKTGIPGVYAVELDFHSDPRGFLAEMYVAERCEERGVSFRPTRCNLSRSEARGTIRGMHWQIAPNEQAKLIYCVRGRAYDVVVDLRPDSPTWGRHYAAELGAEEGQGVFVPPGCAHGWQALTDRSEILYFVSGAYSPPDERGFRYDDPAAGIRWPLSAGVVSARDSSWPPLAPAGRAK